MASVALIPLNRSIAEQNMRSEFLGDTFHQMFDVASEKKATQSKKKDRKKRKIRSKSNKKDKSPERSEPQPPIVEIEGNPSAFTVYSSVRQVVLEQQIRQLSELLKSSTKNGAKTASDDESETDDGERSSENILKVPKIVGIGLCGVFELIRETRESHPALCVRTLKALLDMLQGQAPEGLRNEPAEVIDSLFLLLMELSADQHVVPPKGLAESESLTALACSCLLSLVVARGDTGKMLSAVGSLLMSSPALASQHIQVPGILTQLQKSVQAVLLGQTQLPEWLSEGVKSCSLTHTIPLGHLTPKEGAGGPPCRGLASDGSFLYVHTADGLLKVGTGYAGTIQGHLYCMNQNFFPNERGWLAYAQGLLFYRPENDLSCDLLVINTETLQHFDTYSFEGKSFNPNVMFCDGENIGHIASCKDDGFVIRTFSPSSNPMTVVNELPLKLARKCMDLFGSAPYDPEIDIHSIKLGVDEDVVSVSGGRDFALLRTSSGKVMYSGRSQSLGIKQGGPPAGKWAELPIIKAPRIVQCIVGHESHHALLLTDDGSTFFVGTPKRGEDGDGSLSKARRQAKALKPKKLSKLEGKNVLQAACNSGTSAAVTKDGQLYMFGKDATHCDSSGLVTDLKDVPVAHVALGKAHAIALSTKGHVYSFGINNKGQCGRDFVAREVTMPIANPEEEEEVGEEFCTPGKHRWRHEHCMVCTNCGECTGYGSVCISMGRPDRTPGQRPSFRACGCGSGESGCSECGICRTCAGETNDEEGKGNLPRVQQPGHLLSSVLDICKNSGILPGALDGARGVDMRANSIAARRRVQSHLRAMGAKAAAHQTAQNGASAESDPDRAKISSLAPMRLEFGRGARLVAQVACGLQHSVILTQNGEVFTFGSNQHGQLGLGDANTRGVPCRIHIKSHVAQIAAGSNHTALMTPSGQILTFGSHQKGQLGRPPPEDEKLKERKAMWFAIPGTVPGIGAKHGRRATWIGASGDQTFVRIDESLISSHMLSRSSVIANGSCIGLIPSSSDLRSFRCLMINKRDGSCRSFTSDDQATLLGCSVCLDPMNDVLWSFCSENSTVRCFNVMTPAMRSLSQILNPEMAIPVAPNAITSRSHAAFHLLGCLDSLTRAQQLGLSVLEVDSDRSTQATRVYGKDDYSVVNRFESHGGGWGYSGHSIEAVRFMADSDILLGGIGLFGGRGEYFGKIKVFELGVESDSEPDGEFIAETEDQQYECGLREKFCLMFEEPVSIQANMWYVAWARIQGPSSDCGSSGQATMVTEDQVVFKFKNSKKSNNGTDVNAGQIPQLLYRLPSLENSTSNHAMECTEPAHVLRREFSTAVSPECFESLLHLLNWSWVTFTAIAVDTGVIHGNNNLAALRLDLDRFVAISTACLRLIRMYVCEVYPNSGPSKKTPPECTRLVECIGEARLLLKRILSESNGQTIHQKRAKKPLAFFEGLTSQILDECHSTFTACFHAFYPTAALKWTCLCELLSSVEPTQPNVEGLGRLLAAVMEALCHPLVKLTSLLSVTSEHAYATIPTQGSDDNTPTSPAAVQNPYDCTQRPLLVGHMLHLTEREGARLGAVGQWSFREVLERMLSIVVLPVRQALVEEKVSLPPLLVSNTCALLAAVVGELSASATGIETDPSGSSRPMLTTPNRFTRTSQTPFWNTGNGSPDAICFSVDHPGIVVAGVCLYGGAGHYDYEVELLDDVSDGVSEAPHTGRWNVLEVTRGTYSHEECVNDIAEIKFDKPFLIKENVKYAIKLKNRGGRTLNGDRGAAEVKCPDGTTFTFSACSLSSNGTNNVRGQVPSLLYYSLPQEGDNHLLNNKALAEYQSRRQSVSIASSIFKAASDILQRAQGTNDEGSLSVLASAPLFSSLLPVVSAYIAPVAAIEPRGAVQILHMVKDVLPLISALNVSLAARPPLSDLSSLPDGNTTSEHYAIVESEHPYKPATVTNHKVTFPENVKWMTIEFDAHCRTAQPEDSLQLSIPAPVKGSEEKSWWSVLKRFSGTANWPTQAVVLPGNEVCFSLETASDYVKDEKSSFYGYRCTIIGYEFNGTPIDSLKHLEKEVAFLGGICASSLMKSDILLPPVLTEEIDEDMDQIEDGAQQVLNTHSTLLSRGFALAHTPSINQALDGSLPFCWSSNERTFLKDFVQCATGTSGGRLASWLQPESFLDPEHCEVICNKEELKCGWPSVISVHAKDQYGRLVQVPNLKVEIRAVPVVKDSSTDERRAKRLSRQDDSSLFGGHAPPKLDTAYEVTVRDKKDAYHAICMMKAYDNYSFEELRFAAPSVRRPIENLLVRSNNDGTYSSSWTPTNSGRYKLQVTLDGFETQEDVPVTVKDAPRGLAPPTEEKPSLMGPNHAVKLRRFVGKWSSGLRIRCHPTLQSEVLGIIPPDGVISFVDEFHNDDGVWLRLTQDSLREFSQGGAAAAAGASQGIAEEAWALQYNQLLGKTFLVPLEQPKSILDEILKASIRKKLPELMEGKLKAGPGGYQVVHCGPSGHNVRCQPSLNAAPVGMVILGNQLTAIEELTNTVGVWVKLDATSVSRFCHEVEGEAWCLAQTHDGATFLMHTDNLQEDLGGASVPTFGAEASKGFDFSTARHKPPDFQGGATPSWTPFFKSGDDMNDNSGEEKPSESSAVGPVTPVSAEEGGGASASEEPPRKAAVIPELRGISVKDIAREITKFHLEREVTREIHANYPSPPKPSSSPLRVRRFHLDSDLRGASVKECVRLLGESWVNGNGVTPPRTPPGTPKKVGSRCSSPKLQRPTTSTPRSGSPLEGNRSPLVKRSASTPPRSPSPLASPLPRRHSVRTPPSLHRELTFTRPSAQRPPLSPVSPRSLSCSPQRCASPLATVARAASSSPVRPKSPKKGECSSPKPHFSIGSASPKEEMRMSPKPTRKERSRNLRSKRDRGSSPAASTSRDTTPARSAEPLREAMAPSVAQSLRAVFSAFLWHEGIVHDAMACASYLKFHPNLPKEFPREGSARSTPSKKKKDVNINEAVGKLLKERHHSESSQDSQTPRSPGSLSLERNESALPLTLRHLVLFWEELSGVALKVIEQNVILPSPAVNAREKKGEKDKAKGQNVDKKPKKVKKEKYGARGNLFGESAALFFSGRGDKEALCELCGGLFSHPVTYHMKDAHPGCGHHAGGQGYNSGGNFCGGWAGNCGDGGVGGSTWYLMCDKCRGKYLEEKRQGNKEKSKKERKKNLAPRASLPVLDPHIVMKNNAMFLLDLASSSSSAGLTIPRPVTHRHTVAFGNRLESMLPSVREDCSPDGASPFSPTPFLYLHHHGAEAADSAFADDSVFCDGEPKGLSQSGGQFDPSPTDDPQAMANEGAEMLEPRSGRSMSAQVSPCDAESAASDRPFFQRSISEMSSCKAQPQPEEPQVIMRRRNNSGGLGDDGMSLLKHPSVAMARLIQSVARGSLPRNAGITEQAMRRPVLSFVMQRHDLDSLQIAMRHSLRKAACRVFALQGFNWLLRNVSMLSCIHDLLWHFVSSLSVTEERTEEEQKKELDQDAVLCEHPLWDIGLAGEVVQPLLQTFHAFLQTVSDVTMYLPPGSALQQMAVRCWCLKFRPHDHMFLHKSHVFSNISKILSKSEEGWGVTPQNALPASATKVESYRDITQAVELKASSRQAMLPSLIDGSTETFWESGDEDRNKTKTLTVVCPPHLRTEIIYLHIDNSRDLGNKVSSIAFNAGKSQEDLRKVKQFDVDVRFCGWVHCRSHGAQIVRVELKGADNTLRVRQMKILSSAEALAASANHFVMQQKGCEVETLKVFRLLTSQVFGRLIADDVAPLIEKEANLSDSCDDVDLKEHMVGILFSRNKLSHLQKQVCVHIVQAIRKETIRVQEEWEDKLQSGTSSDMDSSKDRNKMSDAYCFELLSMVLALSGSTVGCQYLSQQHHLLHDLFTLLHTASPRVQRQVTALLRRVLPEVQPQSLAAVLGVPSLPPKDFSILDKGRDPGQLGILDVFLACIAKALVVQTKVKGQGAKSAQTFKLSDCIGHNFPLGQKWWLRGSVSAQLAETIILLLKDLSAGSLSQSWVAVTKSAIAESVLTLTKLDEVQRSPAECIRTPSLWLALASLCVLDQEHVEKLSSGQWAHQAKNRPTCDNHDDGETAAIILCAECGNLCADCDRFLHLHRKTRAHQRQVFKEEEEAIKVDLHEACGRTKLFWLMALADSRTLKAMVEFRDSAKGKLGSSSVSGVCRFCGSTCNSRLMSVGYVCSQKDCQDYATAACNRTLQCGHACGGIRDEEACLPCLHGCQQGALKQDADDMCMICFTEALSAAPAIQLKCGHVFHEQCCQHVLQQRWVGPRISFGFSLCPICKHDIEHNVLRPLLESIRVLQEDVKRKALMRLEYEGLHQAEAITAAGARFHGDPSGYALERYAYYVCYKCKKAYFGGEVRCEEQAGMADEYDSTELVCGACSDVSRAQMCPKHGTDFLEYKCRYCCSVAVFFCFGTTHFCNACHDDFQRVANMPKGDLPHCPAGPKAKQLEGDECPLHVKHPPTGEEFALGCGVCRNAHTF